MKYDGYQTEMMFKVICMQNNLLIFILFCRIAKMAPRQMRTQVYNLMQQSPAQAFAPASPPE